jgi:membrane associated rhomboid family serine protease
MFLPFTVDVPMARLPLANWALIAVTSLISLAMFVSDRPSDWDLPDNLELPPPQNKKNWSDAEWQKFARQFEERLQKTVAPPWSLVPARFSVVQLLSHQLVHGDLLHLVGNMIFLFVFGNAVNAKLGHVMFLGSYFLLGALGGLAWLAFGDGRPMLGASGAIMGIVGMFLVLFPRNDVSVLYFWWGGGGSFELPAFWVILAYMAFDLLGTLRAGEGIAYVSHLAGELVGIALVVTLILVGFIRSTRYEENLLEAMGLSTKKQRKKR